MKKVIYSFLTIAVAGMVFVATFACISWLNGQHVKVYLRAMQVDKSGHKSINWLAAPSLITIESQQIVYDTIKFSDTVGYPLAPKFKVVAPNIDAELYVADSLANVITRKVNKITYNLWCDYDKQAVPTREAMQPYTVSPRMPKVLISATGTASPEDGKNGFEKSIQIGVIEPENYQLAVGRLLRTDSILIHKLNQRKIDARLISAKARELQLSTNEIPKVIKDHSRLNHLRYVVADTEAIVGRIVITPISFPFLLVAVSFGIFCLIVRLQVEEGKKIWFFVYRVIMIIACILAFIWLFNQLPAINHHHQTTSEPFPPIVAWIILVMVAIGGIVGWIQILLGLYHNWDEVIEFFKRVLAWLKWLLGEILAYFVIALVCLILLAIFVVYITVKGAVHLMKWFMLQPLYKKLFLVHVVLLDPILIYWIIKLLHR